MWSARHGGAAAHNGGPIHDLGFDYNWNLKCLPDLPLKFTADAVYNDGTGGPNVDHDWSHLLWGLSTHFKCPLTGATITPGIWFQNSMDKSVNNEDELWGGLSYTLMF